MDVLGISLGSATPTVRDMKTSLVTTLSVVGVLAMGGAAFAANSTILDSNRTSDKASTALTEAIVPATALSNVLAMPVLPTSPGESIPAVPEMIVVPDAAQSQYNVEGVGIVTLEKSATGLTVISVNPVSGWIFDSESKNSTRIEVSFENSNKSVEFRAELIDGRIIAAINVDDDNADEVDDNNPDEVDDNNSDEVDDNNSDEVDDD